MSVDRTIIQNEFNLLHAVVISRIYFSGPSTILKLMRLEDENGPCPLRLIAHFSLQLLKTTENQIRIFLFFKASVDYNVDLIHRNIIFNMKHKKNYKTSLEH